MNSENELITHARMMYDRGWMAGTSGNLSVRTPEGIRITPSGRDKGTLKTGDLLLVREGGETGPVLPVRPSAELSLHQAIYRNRTDAGAVYHVHTVESNIVSEWATSGKLGLPLLEMLKGFGWKPEDPDPLLPVFSNHPDVAAIAREVDQLLSRESQFRLPGYLIRLHGLTVWGNSPEEAFKHVELFDFIFRYMVQSRFPSSR